MMQQSINTSSAIPTSSLNELITAFKSAWQTYQAASIAADVVNPAPYPRVIYAYARDAKTGAKTPLYAYTDEELDKHQDRWSAVSDNNSKFDTMRKVLHSMQEHYDQVALELGHHELAAKRDAEFEKYKLAKMALLRYQPASLWEVTKLAQFVLGCENLEILEERDFKQFLRCLGRSNVGDFLAA